MSTGPAPASRHFFRMITRDPAGHQRALGVDAAETQNPKLKTIKKTAFPFPHRLENPGKIPLELIEVQSGSYLGEDDIVRFEDDYGRSMASR